MTKYYLKNTAWKNPAGVLRGWQNVTKEEYLRAQALAGLSSVVPQNYFQHGDLCGKTVVEEKVRDLFTTQNT